MKRFVAAIALCMALPVWAAGVVSFSLYGVTLADLGRVVLDDVAAGSVVMSPDVLEDNRLLTFAVKSVSVASAVEQFEHVARSRGYDLARKGGVYHLVKSVDALPETLVYLPKYRSVSYLADLVGGIVPRTAIANQRAIQAPPGQMQQQGFETGTNVNSLIDKADKDALVVSAKPRELEQVKKMLAEVDRPIAEMLIKAVVVEVNTGAVEGSAVNLIASAIAKGIGSASFSWKGGADVANGLTLKLGGIEAVWSAISSDTRFKVVSAPQVRVKSGSSARFSVGSDTPVLGAVSYQGNGQSVQSVEYKPSGVILDLKPEIRGALAELSIRQQLSSFAKTETGVNNSPTLMKRELSTSVVVSQNDVVLLGGLDEEKTPITDSGFFFLPKWLRSMGSDKTRSEIVLMLYVERVQTPGESI